MIIVHNILSYINKLEAIKILGYDAIEVVDADDVTEYSAYGTPIFMPIHLGDSSKSNGLIEWNARAVNQLKLLCCVVDISQTRNIVKTEIQGRDGTVKEFISNGDYQINIKGILSNDVYTPNRTKPTKGNRKYPIDAVAHLNEICKAPTAIPIEHRLLYELGIYDIVIESFSFPATPGRTNIQTFELNCISDRTFLLEENENQKVLNA
jgi:hypothetical protein